MNRNSEYDPDKDSEEFQSANPVICGGKWQTLPRSPAKASANNQTLDNVDVVRNRHKHKSGWRYTFSSLSNPGFFFLWLSMVTMMAGMQMLARGYLVYDMTGSAALLGIVNAGHALPMLGLALFGGAIADRFERKLLIQAGQVVPAVLAFVVGIAIFSDNIQWYHLVFVSVIQGSMFSFMMPARQAIIPQLVGKLPCPMLWH